MTNSKKGFAVPLVLIFASILGVLATFIIKQSRQYNKFNETNVAQLQAHFVTRAAFQHAMIKIKLLNRELYDAVCLAQGRNPLFDFTQVTSLGNPATAITSYNPGPIFLYKSGAFTNNNLFTQDFTLAGGLHKKWLASFKADINSGINGSNSIMSLDSVNMPADIKGLMREPFSGQYDITNLDIVARDIAETGPSTVNNVAIVEITVASSITTARGNNWNHEMKKTVKVFRDNVN